MQYKKQDISDRILEAGRNEYAAKGYRGGNISAIATQAGVPVGNLYRYYDGKMGLLTAIVRPAYIQVPKMMNDLFENGSDDAHDNANRIIEKLLKVYDKYGDDLLILADKCASTRYEDFFDKLVEKCDSLLLKRLFENPDEDDLFFCRTISHTFISAVFDVLRRGGERERIKTMLERVVLFYFADISGRIHGGAND